MLQWQDASENAPPIYIGPMCDENALSNCVASLELQDAGLVIEVADSVAVAEGGRGLFVRCLGETESVTLDEGTAVCGYASGEMRSSPDSEGGKSVGFALASLDSVVWFEQQLCAVRDLLEDESIAGIAGHVAEYDAETGEWTAIGLDLDYVGPRYFVPSAEQPQPLTIGAVGQMANDLAVGSLEAEDEAEAAAGYEEKSDDSNLLVLVFRLERDPDDPRVLVPTRPISTLAKSITFVNDVPMEIGCHYGARYWKNRKDVETLQACFQAEAEEGDGAAS